MFINTIDKIIHDYINRFVKFLYKKKEISINNIDNYINELNFSIDFKNYIKDINNINIIKKIIIKYIYIYYLFFENYEYDLNLIKNKLINLNHEYIDNEIISLLILLIKYKNDIIKLYKNNFNISFEYEDIEYINKLNFEYLKLINLDKNNIILMLIFNEIYYKNDKNVIFEILEDESIKFNKYKYLEIISTSHLNYNYYKISNFFQNIDNINSQDINYIYNIININDLSLLNNNNITINDIIENLFNKYKILIPISDEFFLLNKNDLFFINKSNNKIKQDQTQSNLEKDNYKLNEDITIKKIIQRINNIVDFYNKKYDYEDVFDKYYYYRKAFNINDNEHSFILNKVIKNNNYNIEYKEYYNELLNIKKNPYVNFNSFGNNIGFNHTFNNVISSVRYSNIEFNKNIHKLETRTIGGEINANIIGFLIRPYFNISKILNFEKYTNNKLVEINKKKKFINNFKKIKNNFKMKYWIFNDSDIENKKINYISSDNIINQNNNINFEIKIKLLLTEFYKDIEKLVYNNIIEILTNINKNDDIIKLNNYFIKNSINLNILNFYKEFNINNYLIELTDNNYIDNINKKIIYILSKYNIYNNLKKKYIKIKSKIKKLPTFSENNNVENIIGNKYETIIKKTNSDDSICQHIIILKYINKFKKKYINELSNNISKNSEEYINNNNIYNKKIDDYINRYGINNKNENIICKSCGYALQINKYVTNSYDKNNDNIISKYNINNDINYSNYKITIDIFDLIIKKLTLFSNTKYYIGNQYKYMRDLLIKSSIDVINFNYTQKIKYTEYKNINNKLQDINTDISTSSTEKFISKFIIFELNDNFFDDKNNDLYRIIYNNIISLITLLYIISLDKYVIQNLNFDKFYNYTTFNLYGKKYFEKLKILISKNKNIDSIDNYNIFCYLIYYFTSLAIKNNLWIKYKFENNEHIYNQKIFINTLLDQLNFLINYNNESLTNQNKSIKDIINIFIYNINNIYKNNEIKQILLNNENKKIIIDNGKIKIKKNKIEPSLYLTKDYEYKLLKEKKEFKTLNLNNSIYARFIFLKNEEKFILSNNKLKELLIKFKKENIINIKNNYDINGKKIKKIEENEKNKNIEIDFQINNINEIINNINKIKIKNDKKFVLKIKNQNENNILENKKINKFNNLIITEYNNNKYYDKLINIIFLKLNNEFNIGLNKIYLKNNKYIINHDQYGNILEKNILIDENNIIIKKNDNFFKKDIIQYINLKKNYEQKNILESKNIIFYYDKYNLNLIGYQNEKEQIQVSYNKNNNYLKKYKCFEYKLKMFGYETYYIKDTLHDINILRINNIIKSINNFIKITTKINNKTIEQNIYKELFSDLYIILPNLKFIKKLNYLNIKNKNKIDNKINNKNESLNLHIDDINDDKELKESNFLINYFSKLLLEIFELNYENDRILSYFILYINNEFDNYFKNNTLNNIPINNSFKYYLKYNSYIVNLQDIDINIDDVKILINKFNTNEINDTNILEEPTFSKSGHEGLKVKKNNIILEEDINNNEQNIIEQNIIEDEKEYGHNYDKLNDLIDIDVDPEDDIDEVNDDYYYKEMD